MKRRYPNSENQSPMNSSSINSFSMNSTSVNYMTSNIQTVTHDNKHNYTSEIKDTVMVDLTDTPTVTPTTPFTTPSMNPSTYLPLKAGTKRNLSVRDLTDSRDNEEFLKFKKDYGKYKTEEEIWNEELRDIYFS